MSDYVVSFVMAVSPGEVISKAMAVAEQRRMVILELQPGAKLVVKIPFSFRFWSIRTSIEVTPAGGGSSVIISSRMVGVGPWNEDHIKAKTTELQLALMK